MAKLEDYELDDVLKLRGMTRKELAEKIGYGRNSVDHVCSGSHMPSFKIAILISDALDISLDQLVVITGWKKKLLEAKRR